MRKLLMRNIDEMEKSATSIMFPCDGRFHIDFSMIDQLYSGFPIFIGDTSIHIQGYVHQADIRPPIYCLVPIVLGSGRCGEPGARPGFGMLSSRFMFYEMKAAGAKEQSIVYWRRSLAQGAMTMDDNGQ